MASRVYTMTRVATGDYLLPSNDAQTIWRLHTYEDGPSHGLMDWPRDKTLWCLRRWTGEGQYVDTQDWDRWEHVQDGFARRTDAVAAALGVRHG